MLREPLSTLSVAEIMTRWPDTVGVFVSLKMKCVGCPVSRFQTLAQACEDHGIPLDLAASRIEAVVTASEQSGNLPVADQQQPVRVLDEELLAPALD